MPAEPKSHHDRHAATLVQLAGDATRDSVRPPEPGARDCRIGQKLQLWRARRACQRSEAARRHLQRWPEADHPDVWTGTVRDGVARGFSVALEEAISLAAEPREEDPFTAPAHGLVTTGKELRKRRDLLIASGGARCRFSRKGGLLFLDREGGLESKNCLHFEARRDCGSLDGFAADPSERARLFSLQFLPAERLIEAPGYTSLRLAGRLGRGPIGWRCAVTLVGRDRDRAVRLRVEVLTGEPGWRLRARFLGLPAAAITHECTDVHEQVHTSGGHFTAYTLLRSCGVLLVDGEPVAVPDAAQTGPFVHDFSLGASADFD